MVGGMELEAAWCEASVAAIHPVHPRWCAIRISLAAMRPERTLGSFPYNTTSTNMRIRQ